MIGRFQQSSYPHNLALALTSDSSDAPQKNVFDDDVKAIRFEDVDTCYSEQFKPCALLSSTS